ncbi:MAG TPA: hypothetical protein DF427_11075 [Moraxellaceae bacterium]|nr:hypothetical protein [Moraxellaceae bacterium]
MNVRIWLAKSARTLGRVLLWVSLLLVLITLPLLGLLGSETGSRWLLEQGVGMQRVLAMEVRGGTLLTGMELAEVRLHTRKADLYIRRALARWSLLQLLRGEIEIHQLHVDGLVLTLTSPPSRDPIRLPTLFLPIALDIKDLEIRNAVINKQDKTWPVAELHVRGYWHGTNVRVDQLRVREPQYGDLLLNGWVRLLGGYPITAKGQLSPRWLTEKGWQPLQVTLRGEVANLELEAESHGRYRASLAGRVQPLLPSLPYRATLDWSDHQFPWFRQHELYSQAGHLRVIGDKSGLHSQGDMYLKTRYTPSAKYRWQLATDWTSIDFESLKINGLGGELNAKGQFSWRKGLAWNLSAELSRIDLATHWPVPRTVLPVLNGALSMKGSSTPEKSSLDASLRLAGGESWTITDVANGVLWSSATRHKALIEWESVKRPMPGVTSLESDAGELSFSGNASAYAADFSAGIVSPAFPHGVWSGQVTGHDKQVEIENLVYEGDAGGLQAGASLDLSNGVVWSGAVVLNGFRSGWFYPDWSGQFYGSISGQGKWAADDKNVRFDDINVTGSLREQPLSIQGPVSISFPAGRWPHVTSPGFHAAWGGNSVSMTGGLTDFWDAKIDLSLSAPSLLVKGLEGKLSGQVSLAGAVQTPDVRTDLAGDHVGYAGYVAKSAVFKATIPELGHKPANASLVFTGITNQSGASLGNLDVQAGGDLTAHQLSWLADGSPVVMSGLIGGGYDSSTKDWSGQFREGRVSIRSMEWLLQAGAGVPMSWSTAEREFSLDPHCWTSLPARLCAPRQLVVGPDNGQLAMSLTDLRAERLASFMPEGLAWDGSIEGDMQARWAKGQTPVAHARLLTGKGAVHLAREDAEPLTLRYDQLSLELDADEVSVRPQLKLVSTDLGQGHLEAVINPYVEGKPLTGEVALSGLRLELLQPFFPALSVLTGRINGQGRLEGLLAKPRYWGNIELVDGRMALRNAPLVVDEMTALIEVKGDQAELSGQLKSGRGGATLSGSGDWAGEPKLVLNLRGERFELRQEPQLIAEVNPDLHFLLVPGRLDLTGTVRVPYARIKVKELPQRTVALSPDVRVIETEDGQLRARASGRSQSFAIHADVELLLGNDVYFNGFGITGGLTGGLRLRQSPDKGLEASGEVGLDKEARYEAYGQRLKIRRGQLVFAGNIMQPGIDIEAIRVVDDKTVGVRVEGRANEPETTFFSEPSMAQEEILSYLILGAPLSTDVNGANSNAMFAAAALSLGARSGQGLTSGIGSMLGVQDMALSAEGAGDETQVKVSGYLSPDIFLSYGVGVFTPVNTITLRYQVRPRLYLEAASSLENALDLFYNFRF